MWEYSRTGKTRGFQLLVLSVPYRGRAIPFHFLSFSSWTIAQGGKLPKLGAPQGVPRGGGAFGQKASGPGPGVQLHLAIAPTQGGGIDFVVRLNVGLHPRFTRRDGREVGLSLTPGGKASSRGFLYQGEVEVNVGGVWEKGMAEPL